MKNEQNKSLEIVSSFHSLKHIFLFRKQFFPFDYV